MASPTGQPGTQVDWDEVRQRVEAVGEALKHDAASAEARQAIFTARAKALARQLPQLDQGTVEAGSLEIIVFQLAQERYGLESYAVREVHPLKDYTPVPGTPAYVLGIINVRGQVLSVLDLKKLFDLPAQGLTELNKVIILRSANMTFGLLADAILDVRRVALSELQPSLPTLTGIRQDFLKGVTRERVVVLDAQKLLADSGLVVKDEAGS